MSLAIQTRLPIAPRQRLDDLPRQAQFLLLTLRLARELSVEDRHFQGFVYTLCGVSRVEAALAAVTEVLRGLGRAPRRIGIQATAATDITADEGRLLALLQRNRQDGAPDARGARPWPQDEQLVQALGRLAETLR